MQATIKRIEQRKVATIEEYLGWQFNAVLTGVQYKRKQTHWLAVIKATFPDGKRVSFVQSKSLYSLLELVDELVSSSSLFWQEDRPWNPHRRSGRALP